MKGFQRAANVKSRPLRELLNCYREENANERTLQTRNATINKSNQLLDEFYGPEILYPETLKNIVSHLREILFKGHFHSGLKFANTCKNSQRSEEAPPSEKSVDFRASSVVLS